MDSQIVKAHEYSRCCSTSGYHGRQENHGKGQAPGRRCRGLAVGPGGHRRQRVSDKAGAKLLLISFFDPFSNLKIMWADSGYDGAPLARYAKAVASITVEVVLRTSLHSFQVVRRRWVVERTLRLADVMAAARTRLRAPHRESREVMVHWATVFIIDPAARPATRTITRPSNAGAETVRRAASRAT